MFNEEMLCDVHYLVCQALKIGPILTGDMLLVTSAMQELSSGSIVFGLYDVIKVREWYL